MREGQPVLPPHEEGVPAALVYEELLSQSYGGVRPCTFSAGFVHGHPVDTLYLRLARPDEEPTTIVLRPDEALALAWCLNGALWSERMRRDKDLLSEQERALEACAR